MAKKGLELSAVEDFRGDLRVSEKKTKKEEKRM